MIKVGTVGSHEQDKAGAEPPPAICLEKRAKEIRDDKGSWNQLEKYISEHSEVQFSHGICDNTGTHVLGVRAFGTQLLCEQVIGRALRRQSYDLNDEGLFDAEYADVLGL